MEALAESFLGHYMFKSDNKKHFVIGLGFTSLINHAVDANSEFLISIDNIVIKAKRAIAAGAEVTIDYGWRAEDWALAGVAKMPD